MKANRKSYGLGDLIGTVAKLLKPVADAFHAETGRTVGQVAAALFRRAIDHVLPPAGPPAAPPPTPVPAPVTPDVVVRPGTPRITEFGTPRLVSTRLVDAKALKRLHQRPKAARSAAQVKTAKKPKPKPKPKPAARVKPKPKPSAKAKPKAPPKPKRRPAPVQDPPPAEGVATLPPPPVVLLEEGGGA